MEGVKKMILLKNKKIQYDYFIEKTYEAGISLEGWEVKSILAGKAQLVDSFVKSIHGELFIVGFTVQGLITANSHKVIDNNRFKKVLLHRKEINDLIGKVTIKGYTLMCNEVYKKDGKLKAKICLCKGKKNYDKRQSEKDKDIKMNLNRKDFSKI